MQSAVSDGGRWRLLFDWGQMMEVQEGAVGDWWADWLGSSCPALVLRAGHSTLLDADLARQMVTRRPNTRLAEFPSAGSPAWSWCSLTHASAQVHTAKAGRTCEAFGPLPRRCGKGAGVLADDGHEKLPRDGQIAARWRP
jgi:hypothetical protein